MTSIGPPSSFTKCITAAAKAITADASCTLPWDADEETVLDSICASNVTIPAAILAEWQALQTYLQSIATTENMKAARVAAIEAAKASVESVKASKIQNTVLLIGSILALATALHKALPRMFTFYQLDKLCRGKIPIDSAQGRALAMKFRDNPAIQLGVIALAEWHPWKGSIKIVDQFMKEVQRLLDEENKIKKSATTSVLSQLSEPRGRRTDEIQRSVSPSTRAGASMDRSSRPTGGEASTRTASRVRSTSQRGANSERTPSVVRPAPQRDAQSERQASPEALSSTRPTY